MQIPPYLLMRVIAAIIGILLFVLLTAQTKEKKKKRVETFVSLLTTIFIWMFVMKFVTKFPLLLEHPLTVLAYPSGTLEFYLGLVVTGIVFVRTIRKEKWKTDTYKELFQLFAATMFSFYFLITVFYGERPLVELSLWFVLYIGSLLVKKHQLFWFSASMATAIIASLFSSAPNVMGIRIHAAFYLIVGTVLVIGFLIQRRRVT
ncbi:hypothetical protein H0266_10545 [Halobacillus locisalis]|uniref:Uncharacterized protein n=1 Tax=Halobacillus locisalis TaxID=220753 RepID=A0A838CU84_9BACI|nr:hypothetical protein [Halobacillus locisalis]MBA2175335.1 hypothetical protein [Halobacillus locisalis]